MQDLRNHVGRMQQAKGEVHDHQNRHPVPAETEPLKPEQLNVIFLCNFLQRAGSARMAYM